MRKKTSITDRARLKYKPKHQYDYDPNDFADYRPSSASTISKEQALILSKHIHNVLALDDESAFILCLRFGFEIECNTIRQVVRTQKKINGICEAFRFGCQRYLNLPAAISGNGMMHAFQIVLQDHEILFLNNGRGICWTQQKSITIDEHEVTIKKAFLYSRCRSFIQFEDAGNSASNHAPLTKHQTRKLAEYILELPIEFGSILLLYYYCKLNPREIEIKCGTRYVKGKIEYFRNLFTQRIGLPNPIADISFVDACQLITRKMQLD